MKLFLKLSMITASMIFFTFTGWCTEDTVVYFALQYGNQDTGSPVPLVGSKDTYLSTLEETHGDMNENRDGAQSGELQYAASNLIPRFAKESIFGVFAILWPYVPQKCGAS